jgi:hypothetical protein
VVTSGSHVSYAKSIESFDATGRVQGSDISVAEFAIVPFTPGEYSAIGGQSQGVASAGMHGYFPYDVLRQSGDLMWRVDVSRMTQSQSSVATFSASIGLY